MSDQFIGEIRMFPFNFAPYGWAQCDGQILPISQYAALFSLLGTNFGGNGQSNFGLPNLQGQAAMDAGNGPGLTPRDVGESGGTTNVTVLYNEMPLHMHLLNGDTTVGTSKSPSGNLIGVAAINPRDPHEVYVPGAATTQMLANNAGPSGGNLPHNNMQPYLAINFCIALSGVFPTRG
jgi:microcystin-dependent protein